MPTRNESCTVVFRYYGRPSEETHQFASKDEAQRFADKVADAVSRKFPDANEEGRGKLFAYVEAFDEWCSLSAHYIYVADEETSHEAFRSWELLGPIGGY